jgi:hypothetical protein
VAVPEAAMWAVQIVEVAAVVDLETIQALQAPQDKEIAAVE